jgi:tetratricopeptide (TPR) repeat protein
MTDLSSRLRTALADRYAIERELGSGGMATVYLARDLKHDRQVALKVLKPELAHAVGADRFLREIRITAGLNHPHILPLLDSGEADGFLYFVMPYVAGESLRERLDREGRLPIDEALRIAEQVASALEHAHSHEVIHRDIKPENILLHEGEAMVADFGIAVAVSVAGGERLTETGIAVGTPAFMSPEQASGDEEIDERSDIYSLGCVLYEMLGGEAPHGGTSPREILAQKVLSEPRSIRELRPEADAALEAVLARALEAAPEDRFATAGELGEALRSPDVGWALAAKRLRARRRKVAAVTAAGLVVVVLGVGAILHYMRGQAEPTRLAVLPFEYVGAAEDEYYADEIIDEIRSRLRAASALDVMARLTSVHYKDTELSIAEIGDELDVDYLVGGTFRRVERDHGERPVHIAAELIRVSDGVSIWNKPYDAIGLDIFEAQIDIVQAVIEALGITPLEPERRSLTARPTEDLQAYDYYTLGRNYLAQWTVEGFEEAIEFFHRAVEADSTYAQGYAGLAYTYATLVSFTARQDVWPDARGAAEQALAIDERLAEAHIALAMEAMSHRYDWSAAENELGRALELEPSSVDALLWCAVLQAIGKRYDDAIENSERALRLDPRNVRIRYNLAVFLVWAGRHGEALRALDDLIASEPDYDVAYEGLAVAYAAQGKYEEAVSALHAAIDLPGEDLDIWLGWLGYLYGRLGQRADASEQLERLDELAASGVHVSPVSRAHVYAGLAENDSALAWLENAYQGRDHWMLYLEQFPFFWGSLPSDPRFQELVRRMDYPGPTAKPQ